MLAANVWSVLYLGIGMLLLFRNKKLKKKVKN